MADYDYEDYDDFVDEETTDEESGRVTEKPEIDSVEFTVVRAFTWHGTEFEIGEHELPQDEYEAMMYDINLRQDRVRLVL